MLLACVSITEHSPILTFTIVVAGQRYKGGLLHILFLV